MPLDELGAQALGGLFKVLGRVLLELLFELPVRGLGHGLLRATGRRVRPDDAACIWTGLAFWAAVAVAAWVVLRATAR